MECKLIHYSLTTSFGIVFLHFEIYKNVTYLFCRSRDMATTCPKPGSCGTKAPVWLRFPDRVYDTSKADMTRP